MADDCFRDHIVCVWRQRVKLKTSLPLTQITSLMCEDSLYLELFVFSFEQRCNN